MRRHSKEVPLVACVGVSRSHISVRAAGTVGITRIHLRKPPAQMAVGVFKGVSVFDRADHGLIMRSTLSKSAQGSEMTCQVLSQSAHEKAGNTTAFLCSALVVAGSIARDCQFRQITPFRDRARLLIPVFWCEFVAVCAGPERTPPPSLLFLWQLP